MKELPQWTHHFPSCRKTPAKVGFIGLLIGFGHQICINNPIKPILAGVVRQDRKWWVMSWWVHCGSTFNFHKIVGKSPKSDVDGNATLQIEWNVIFIHSIWEILLRNTIQLPVKFPLNNFDLQVLKFLKLRYRLLTSRTSWVFISSNGLTSRPQFHSWIEVCMSLTWFKPKIKSNFHKIVGKSPKCDVDGNATLHIEWIVFFFFIHLL